MYIIERFGNILLPTLNVIHPQDTGEAAAQMLNLPGGGAYDLDGNNQGFSGAYPLSVPCTIANRNEAILLSQYEQLRGLRGQRNRLYRRVYDGSLRWAWARMTGLSGVRPYGNENRYKLDLTLNFVINGPIWYGITRIGYWNFDDGLYFDTALMFDDTDYVIDLTGAGTIINPVNLGNAPNSNVVFRYTAKTSQTTALDVSMLFTDPIKVVHWGYAGIINVDSMLEIDCGAKTIKLDGVGDYGNFALDAAHNNNDWLPMYPGGSSITISGTGGADNQLKLIYSDGWF